MLVDLKELAEANSPGSRILGLDLGEKTIGIALSDTQRTIASPFGTRSRTTFEKDFGYLIGIMQEHGALGLVVGLPLNMNGSEGPSAQSARAFARNFAKRSNLPVLLWDERLSTAAVTRTLLSADASRRRRSKVVDKMAAAYLLQGALDAMKHMKSRIPP
jgi:putative Holliday junction resolvase